VIFIAYVRLRINSLLHDPQILMTLSYTESTSDYRDIHVYIRVSYLHISYIKLIILNISYASSTIYIMIK